MSNIYTIKFYTYPGFCALAVRKIAGRNKRYQPRQNVTLPESLELKVRLQESLYSNRGKPTGIIKTAPGYQEYRHGCDSGRMACQPGDCDKAPRPLLLRYPEPENLPASQCQILSTVGCYPAFIFCFISEDWSTVRVTGAA
jgi:hypothetical protein